MSAHIKASEESRNLCESLFESLSEKIPSLERKETKQWCALYQTGRKRFAYINHRKTLSRIEVWCLGDADKLKNSTTSLEVIPREKISSGWEESFQARFIVDHLSEIKEASDLLYRVSYQYS